MAWLPLRTEEIKLNVRQQTMEDEQKIELNFSHALG